MQTNQIVFSLKSHPRSAQMLHYIRSGSNGFTFQVCEVPIFSFLNGPLRTTRWHFYYNL